MPVPKDVNTYIATLDHRHRDAVAELRHLVLAAVPGIHERIKWNAPSFGLGDDDRVTMRLQPGDRLQLVLHRGVAVKDATGFEFDDPAGLVKWQAKDRGVVTVLDHDDIRARRGALEDLVRRWVAATS